MIGGLGHLGISILNTCSRMRTPCMELYIDKKVRINYAVNCVIIILAINLLIMSDDLIRQLGYANLDTRLKRISDKMSHSTRAMYKALGIDIEPSWYLVLVMVRESPNISVMEIAQRLRFTHQSIISLTDKMVSAQYLNRSKDVIDKRKTVFRITQKAVEAFPRIQEIWDIGTEVIYELLNGDTSITHHLEVLESNLETSSFGERIINKMNAEK